MSWRGGAVPVIYFHPRQISVIWRGSLPCSGKASARLLVKCLSPTELLHVPRQGGTLAKFDPRQNRGDPCKRRTMTIATKLIAGARGRMARRICLAPHSWSGG